MKELYKLNTRPVCLTENVIQGDKYRFTLLTDRLVRMEYSEDGIFEDRATQTVLNRDFSQTVFSVKEAEDQIEIYTKYMQIVYNKKEFSAHGLSIKLQGYKSCGTTWHYGDEFQNLKGTARTLDTINGACELETGVMSKRGGAVLDDSRTLVIDESGWVVPRKKGICDLYFFAYGHDYRECLNDFYYLCGRTPMLPRFALGNWWSRYYKYTEQSYMELMERFDQEQVPFSVAVIDMDWHLVDIDPKYGSGWTGYTWNRDFFPDPERFLKWLHERGMKTTLNVHPADGVRGHEEIYPKMAEAMGIDPATEEPVNFDIADPKFLENYFSVLCRSLEDQGVDFWWIDWQQGGNTKVEGLDPLWMLNHFHYLDSAHDGKRPMTFSRYAGPGSHRYPVGFSGDTHITWDSLDFQPYFTNTASNIGYGWWSHDIGGHMMGEKSDEMAARWLQYGVFSPIMRLHSTCNDFAGKEPWRYRMDIHQMMNKFLRLRHEMIPYLYTMNYRAYKENLPIIQPMYYSHPEEKAAYEVKNQYWFGSELIVAPITTETKPGVNKASVMAWLPEGLYFDIFTGMNYQGGQKIEMYRDINSIPVLAKAGAIIPFTEQIFGSAVEENPETLTLRVYGGADGNFTMYEDDNKTCGYEKDICVTTQFDLNWSSQKQSIVIHPAQGELALIPEQRAYTVEFYGCEDPGLDSVKVLVDGAEMHVKLSTDGKMAAGKGQADSEEAVAKISYDYMQKCVKLMLPKTTVTCEVKIIFSTKVENVENAAGTESDCGYQSEKRLVLAPNRIREMVFDFLNMAEIGFDLKTNIYNLVSGNQNRLSVINELRTMELDEALMGCLMEMVAAY